MNFRSQALESFASLGCRRPDRISVPLSSRRPPGIRVGSWKRHVPLRSPSRGSGGPLAPGVAEWGRGVGAGSLLRLPRAGAGGPRSWPAPPPTQAAPGPVLSRWGQGGLPPRRCGARGQPRTLISAESDTRRAESVDIYYCSPESGARGGDGRAAAGRGRAATVGPAVGLGVFV